MFGVSEKRLRDKENVKTRTTRSRTREEKRKGNENADDTKLIVDDRSRPRTARSRSRTARSRSRTTRSRSRTHEADRGPHEAEQEKTKFLGPKFCRSGIGILRKGEVKSRNSKQQIHRKHFYFKNKDNKHVNCKKMSYNNTSSMQISAGSSECTRQIFFLRELKETPSSNWKIPCQIIMFGVKSGNSKQQVHRKHLLLKNKDNKHVNAGSSKCTVILSVMYHSNVSGRSSELRAVLIAGFIRRVLFVNNGLRELKETPSSNWKIPCQIIMFGVKSRNSKQQIHKKHFLLKNKDNKHYANFSWFIRMYSNIQCSSFSDLRAVLIAAKRDSVDQLENSVPSNHVRRERKETIEQLKILYLPIMFGNGAKKMLKHGRHEAEQEKRRDRGRHEADRGRHEADRGRHEAVEEKTKFLGPQFCRSGIGILRKGEI
ncbi:hypothetical protein T08_9192 [Trichinella sp. T8]|nr:hypothetical protein T08_9192 [Trichinella sp. T8]